MKRARHQPPVTEKVPGPLTSAAQPDLPPPDTSDQHVPSSATSALAASAAETRARAAERRGIGDVDAVRKNRERIARQLAAGTSSYFGAARALALRENLRRRCQPAIMSHGNEATPMKPEPAVSGDEPAPKRVRVEGPVSHAVHVHAALTAHRAR